MKLTPEQESLLGAVQSNYNYYLSEESVLRMYVQDAVDEALTAGIPQRRIAEAVGQTNLKQSKWYRAKEDI